MPRKTKNKAIKLPKVEEELYIQALQLSNEVFKKIMEAPTFEVAKAMAAKTHRTLSKYLYTDES